MAKKSGVARSGYNDKNPTTFCVYVYVTKDEYDKFRETAESNGESLSLWARRSLLRVANEPDAPPSAQDDEKPQFISPFRRVRAPR